MPDYSFTTRLSHNSLISYVTRQVNNFFPDDLPVSDQETAEAFAGAIKRLSICFRHINRKYYNENGNAVFNHLHSDHYAMFLYILSNEAFVRKNANLAEKLFLLNKTLNGLDAFYSIRLPEVFLFVHPVGTVLGNADYGNFFTVYQNCGVGSLEESGKYPTIGEGTVMYARSCVLGDSVIGRNVVLGANSFVVSCSIPENSVVVGQYPEHRIMPNKVDFRTRIFHF